MNEDNLRKWNFPHAISLIRTARHHRFEYCAPYFRPTGLIMSVHKMRTHEKHGMARSKTKRKAYMKTLSKRRPNEAPNDEHGIKMAWGFNDTAETIYTFQMRPERALYAFWFISFECAQVERYLISFFCVCLHTCFGLSILGQKPCAHKNYLIR